MLKDPTWTGIFFLRIMSRLNKRRANQIHFSTLLKSIQQLSKTHQLDAYLITTPESSMAYPHGNRRGPHGKIVCS